MAGVDDGGWPFCAGLVASQGTHKPTRTPLNLVPRRVIVPSAHAISSYGGLVVPGVVSGATGASSGYVSGGTSAA
jgi:hypothetical protein